MTQEQILSDYRKKLAQLVRDAHKKYNDALRYNSDIDFGYHAGLVAALELLQRIEADSNGDEVHQG